MIGSWYAKQHREQPHQPPAHFPGFIVRELLAEALMVDGFEFFDVTAIELHHSIMRGPASVV